MKKNMSFQTSGFVALIALVLLWGACSQEPESVDKGVTWKSTDDSITFVLYENGSFSCDLTKKLYSQTTVTGTLDKSEPGLGSNEYTMNDLQTDNAGIKGALEGFNGTKVKLEYTNDGNRFTFSSDEPAVQGFFGGTYEKVR
jgi:hypothetical protein